MSPAQKKARKSRDLLLELRELRLKLEEAEETLRAIRSGDVDGLVIQGHQGTRLFTLKGADESYRTLVEAMNEGALILDANLIVLYGNRRISQILKLALSQVIGIHAPAFVPPDLRGAFTALMVESWTDSLQRELVLRRSDHTLVPVQISTSPASFDGVRRLCVVISDLTEQKSREADRAAEQQAAQDEIRRHAIELEASNRELEAFIYSVSHDLRAPLRHIHRFSTLLQEDYSKTLGPEAQDFLGRISSSAEHMDGLIGGLLGYSKLSRGEITLRTVDTTAVVNGVLQQLSEDLKESRADLQVRAPLDPVRADLLLLSQAVSNLVSNALKFVAKGKQPTIRIRTDDRGSRVRLWIEDQGIGISRQHLEKKLFRVFERLAGEEYPGTGIGLAIVKRAADRMGGSVGVESEPGKGSSFWIELQKPENSNP